MLCLWVPAICWFAGRVAAQMADLRPKGEAMAAPVGGGIARIDRTKKGVILVFAVVAGFAAYGYLSQHYEKRQKQDREFAADANRQVELMTEAHLIGEASPQQTIDMHNADEAAMLATVQRTTIAAAAGHVGR